MEQIKSKKALEMILSRLKSYEKPKVRAEQYITPSDIAALAIWHAYMKNDIKGKVSADLGCGTGILGIAALLMGAKKAYFVDNDGEALEICKNNIDLLISESLIKDNFEILHKDIAEFNKKADTVLQNPPFGTKVRHADKKFLEKAFKIAPVIYTFHKSETFGFVRAIVEDNDFVIDEKITMKMPLKAQFEFHRRRIQRINVDFYRITKKA